jgi:hypothetical protein
MCPDSAPAGSQAGPFKSRGKQPARGGDLRLSPPNNLDGGLVEAEMRSVFDKISKKRYILGYAGIRGNQLVIPGDQT